MSQHKSIFEEQISRKPNLYPWTEQFIEAMHNGFWTDKEFNFKRCVPKINVYFAYLGLNELKTNDIIIVLNILLLRVI